LYVLTAPVDAQTGWLTAQMQLAALSTNSVHLVVDGADHVALLENQADSEVTVQAVLQVVTATRTGRPLAGS